MVETSITNQRESIWNMITLFCKRLIRPIQNGKKKKQIKNISKKKNLEKEEKKKKRKIYTKLKGQQ